MPPVPSHLPSPGQVPPWDPGGGGIIFGFDDDFVESVGAGDDLACLGGGVRAREEGRGMRLDF